MRFRSLLVALSLSLATVACSGDGDDGPGPGSPDSGPQVDAGPRPDASGGTLGYMEPCDLENDTCDAEAELFCFGFNAKGPHCTRECSAPEDCEAPSSGCNNMGVCKAPD